MQTWARIYGHMTKIFAPIILFNIDKEAKNDTLVTQKS
jgi:hypothetical protein